MHNLVNFTQQTGGGEAQTYLAQQESLEIISETWGNFVNEANFFQKANFWQACAEQLLTYQLWTFSVITEVSK